MPHIASIHIHPVKSLGSLEVEEATTTDRGFENDRRWMLVDETGGFLTQREHPEMARFKCEATVNGFAYRIDEDSIEIPAQVSKGKKLQTRIWSSSVKALEPSEKMSAWFCEKLEQDCHLVFMPDSSKRNIDGRYAQGLTSFTDGFPYLFMNQASLNDLNARLERPVPMNRFRPNLVVEGWAAFAEDDIKQVEIGNALFDFVKPCSRCVITTTDQETGQRSKEPLRTLATYRKVGSNVNLGINAVSPAGIRIRTGAKVKVV